MENETMEPVLVESAAAPGLTEPQIIAVINRLVAVAPGLIRRAWGRSNYRPRHECVKCSWICTHVMKRLNIEAEPLHLIAEVTNTEYLVWEQTGVDHPRAFINTNDPAHVAEGAEWPLTHAVAYVPAVRMIVDLASFQLARPDWGCYAPGAIALPWDGARAERTYEWGVQRYSAYPPGTEPIGFGPDWRHGERELRQLTDHMAKVVKKGLPRAGGALPRRLRRRF